MENKKIEKLEIEIGLLQQILTYLSNKPYLEVHQLINSILKLQQENPTTEGEK